MDFESRLKKIEDIDTDEPWPPPLLSAYLERRIQEVLPVSSLTIHLFESAGAEDDRRARTEAALRQGLEKDFSIHYRPDGKPLVSTGEAISVAHAENWTLVVTHGSEKDPLGCDLEAVEERPLSLWRDLLGPERLPLAQMLSREAREDSSLVRGGMPEEGRRRARRATDIRRL